MNKTFLSRLMCVYNGIREHNMVAIAYRSIFSLIAPFESCNLYTMGIEA